jgi:hypothetical protein
LRQPSHRSRWPQYQDQAVAMAFDADFLGCDASAGRAGRPRSNAGVLVRRNPASQARSAVQFGQPPAVGKSAEAWRCAFTKDKRRASTGRMLPTRMPAATPLIGSFGGAIRASTRGRAAR